MLVHIFIPIGTSEKQVKFNFSHMPLIGNISNMTKTVVVLLVWIFLLNNQNNSLLKIQSQQEYLPLWHISYIHILMESNLWVQSWSINQETGASSVYIINWKMEENGYFWYYGWYQWVCSISSTDGFTWYCE